MSGSWDTWDTPDAWAKPRRWLEKAVQVPKQELVAQGEAVATDQFGLASSIYQRFPASVKYFIAITLGYLNIPKDQPPQGVGFGTVPELCFYGLLLDAGFRPAPNGFFGKTPRSFLFQSRLLGGRIPGGAVADFVVFINARAIAVRVQSVFHDERNPFGSGGAKTEEDRRQLLRLRSANFLDNVVDVNRPIDGTPLENGPMGLIRNDLRRVMAA